MDKILKVAEGFAILIALYLIVKNADGFAQVTKAIGSVTSDNTKALQGR